VSFIDLILGLSLNYKLGIAVFTFTVSAYGIMFYFGRRWRNEFESKGVSYWSASKGERIQELMDDVWEPKKITLLYGISYFANGFVRSTFSLWVPIFLLDEVGVSTAEASLFVGLMYISWSWKMFVGLVADMWPFKWGDRYYKRKPWFVVTGVLYLLGIAIMIISDIYNAPVWTVLFPAVVSIITAGAFYDMAADSFAIDVTPPEYHARVIGGASTAGQSVGSALATILPLWLLGVGGYKLVFTLAGVTGLTSFLFLSVKEPEVVKERSLSREAIAFTFTEKTVVIAILIMFSRSFTVMKITAPLGGMFSFTVREIVARLEDSHGREYDIRLAQNWPVRRPLPNQLLRKRASTRLYPEEPLLTTQRVIDTFFPVARGGTACIPGPFGAGKTVLQNMISRHSAVDVVIVVACGERAGEVVETITEFPKMTDPKTGGSLMDRTIIICNTSSMPVAAREASIYTGITLGEYYRQMGFDVLLIADSTSRWAQAMRETAGRLEEIPGEEGFPAYLESSIKGVYERAGVLQTNDRSNGSLTIIGTVSPAGGNFDEPVTQATLSTVKDFLGLSAERAYKRFYPAVDPLLSWSRYSQQLESWFDKNVDAGWTRRVSEMQDLLGQGDAVSQMMQVTGEEGVTLEDFIAYQKALFLDMVFLQQDSFDPVDSTVNMERQKMAFNRVYDLVTRDYRFDGKEQARDYFTRLTGLFKNFNYTREDSPDYRSLLQQIDDLADSVSSYTGTQVHQESSQTSG